MGAFLLRRFLRAAAVLWLVTLLVFLMIRALPGDALIVRLGATGRVPPDQLAAARTTLGLDKPLLKQYLDWSGGLLQGHFGDSLVHQDRDIGSSLLRALAVTAENVLLTSLVGVLLAVPIAAMCAARPGSPVDAAARLFSVFSLAMPTFWLATMTIALLSRWFAYFPPVGYSFAWEHPGKNLEQHYLPALILGFSLAGPLIVLLRATLLDVLREEYIRTARAKGLRESTVLMQHALPNAAVPVVALYGQLVTALLGGAVILELLFNLPGIGGLTYQAATERDYTQIEANALALGGLTVTASLAAELLCARIDPRRHRGRSAAT